jgi:hypothetical protein
MTDSMKDPFAAAFGLIHLDPTDNPTNEVKKKVRKRKTVFAKPAKVTDQIDPAKPMLINDGEKKRYLCPFAGCEQRYFSRSN